MKLEVKNTDKKANLTILKSKARKSIASMGILSSLVLFSGCSKNVSQNMTPPEINTENTTVTEESTYQETNEITIDDISYEIVEPIEQMEKNKIKDIFVTKDTIVDIPEDFKYNVAAACNLEDYDAPITVGDLEKLQGIDGSLFLIMYKQQPLDWLKYCKNLEYLTIVVKTEDTSIFKEIEELPNLKNFHITTYDALTFNKEDFKFVENANSLTDLTLEGFYTEPGFVESLTTLKSLSIEVNDINPEIDYSKLTFLDELSFSICGPYDIAVEFTTDDYNTLIDNGVTIITGNTFDIDKLIEINKKLDSIVASLDLTENSTNQEKLDAILIYVLDNLTYDPKIAEDLINDSIDKFEAYSFYDGGNLYGALEKDTAICGNYAALVDALAERVGLDMHFVTSSSHAWNLTTIDGDTYYIDATWLDGNYVQQKATTNEMDDYGNLVTTNTIRFVPAVTALKEGLKGELDWYMEDPNNLPETYNQDDAHEIIHMPTFIKLNDNTNQVEVIPEETIIPEQSVPAEIENTIVIDDTIKPETENYEVKIGNKKWIVPAGAAIGIMAGLSGVAVVHSKKKKEADRRRYEMQRRQELEYMYPEYFTSFEYNNTYDDYYSK